MWKAFGRGFDSRRLHLFLALILLCGSLSAQQDQLLIFDGPRKLSFPLLALDGIPYIRLSDLHDVFGLSLNSVAGNQNFSVTSGDHNVILSSNRSLVSLDERLVPLSKPVRVVQGAWYVPLDFVPKVLKIISGKQFLWLENSRSLILGEVQPNQLTLNYSPEGDHSRLVFQSVRPVGFTVSYERNVITVTPQSEDILPGFQDTDFSDGIIRKLTTEAAGKRRIFRIETDKDYASYKVLDLNNPPRLVLEVYRKTGTAPAIVPPAVEIPAEKQAPPSMLPSAVKERKVIVLDPGHGGLETGAAGPEGTFEKDVVLSIARKLKMLLESDTGLRVILTRDGDQQVTLDDRTALANNNKADLFVSIHANATLRGVGKGAETYFLSAQATDDDSRNIAAVENNAIGINQELPEAGDDLKLILWDMAQTEYLSESSRLAEMIQQEMNSVLRIPNRGIKQAPFRVLMGATMPAVLIEVGFINNPAEEKLMKDSEYQMKIATAIYRSIHQFQISLTGQAQMKN